MNIDAAKSSWITPDGEIHAVLFKENHDNELPSRYATVGQTEKVCLRISCGYGWNSPYSSLQLPDRITTNQRIVLSNLDENIPCFKNLKMFYFIGGWFKEINYADLLRMM